MDAICINKDCQFYNENDEHNCSADEKVILNCEDENFVYVTED